MVGLAAKKNRKGDEGRERWSLQPRRPGRIWRLRHYLLTGTIRQIGSRTRLLLTLTDIQSGAVVWRDHLFSPFDALIDGFDDVVSKIARFDRTEVKPSEINKFIGSATHRQKSEEIWKEREKARLAHNSKMKRILTRGERNFVLGQAKDGCRPSDVN